MQDLPGNLKSSLGPMIAAEAAIWTPVQFLNFRLLPVQQHQMFVNIMSIVEAAVLSWCAPPPPPPPPKPSFPALYLRSREWTWLLMDEYTRATTKAPLRRHIKAQQAQRSSCVALCRLFPTLLTAWLVQACREDRHRCSLAGVGLLVARHVADHLRSRANGTTEPVCAAPRVGRHK